MKTKILLLNILSVLDKCKIEILYSVAIFGIICGIIGFYGQNGFDLKWFLCLHLPLYIFCIWALWKAYQMYKQVKRNN